MNRLLPLAFCLVASLPCCLVASSPAGVYVLGLEGRPPTFLLPYLENPDLDGFSLRAGWYQAEPAEGVYDWSPFDAVIEQASAYGKKVYLRVVPGVYTPDWVCDAGAAAFEFTDDNPYHATYGQTQYMPVPWDSVYLDKWFEFVAAFGERYANDPAVTIVAVTGPSAGGEMHLAAKRDAAGWRAAGYSEAVLLDAWQQTIDAFVAAFPDTHLSVAIANPVGFGRPARVVDGVADYCVQCGVGLQGNWLSARTSPRFGLYRRVSASAADAPVGFQMLCSATQARFGSSLRQAVDIAVRGGASFLEIYRADVTRFPADVARAHRLLTRAREVAADAPSAEGKRQ